MECLEKEVVAVLRKDSSNNLGRSKVQII
jgi:hypothetical protein